MWFALRRRDGQLTCWVSWDCLRTSSMIVASLKGHRTGKLAVAHGTYLKPYHTLVLKCIFISTPYDVVPFHRSVSHLLYTGLIPPLVVTISDAMVGTQLHSHAGDTGSVIGASAEPCPSQDRNRQGVPFCHLLNVSWRHLSLTPIWFHP